MAEWGKYLRDAVANVEQQLDKVLLENQNDSNDAKSSSQTAKSTRPRPDLSERLKLAAAGRSDTQSDDGKSNSKETRERTGSPASKQGETTADEPSEESKPQNPTDLSSKSALPIELLTVRDFISPPDFTGVLTKARQLALAVKRDDAVDLVDSLEDLEKSNDVYTKNIDDRLLSLHSKLALMSANNAESSQGAEQKISLLMEEGQRLSQQELKLNMLIKKLRAEKREAQSKADELQGKSQESHQLRDELTRVRAENREFEVLIANYRAQLREESPMIGDSNGLAPASKGQSRRASINTEKFEEERDKWQRLETQLLQRITELEQASSHRHQTTSRLQESLTAAQKQSRDAQSQLVLLQDELDALKESSQHQIRQMQIALENKAVVTSPAPVDTSSNADPTEVPQILIEDTNPLSGHLQAESEPASPTDNRDQSRDFGSSFDEIYEVGDEQTVGPAGPFGALEDGRGALEDLSAEDGLYGIENETARSAEPDSFSFLTGNRSRQDSLADSMNDGANSHIVKKLTLSLRKLQNDLYVAKQDAELARQQRQEAQNEIVKHLGAQEQLESLQTTHDQLTASHAAAVAEINRLKEIVTDRTEQIDELEADVRDLKEMYKDQIEALIDEIEKLKN